MKLITWEHHTIDLDALPESPVVLDVGCRDFGFDKTLLKHRPSAKIIGLDPDIDIPESDCPAGVIYLRRALVGDDRTSAIYAVWGNGEGNFLTDHHGVPSHAEKAYEVPCVTISALMAELGITYWDVVKLDCEGSEFQILEMWPGPIAGQITAEFHDWGEGQQRYTAQYYSDLFAGPLRNYEVLQHKMTPLGPAPTWGHWDSLFRLRAR